MEDLEDLEFKIGFSRRCDINLGASIKVYDVWFHYLGLTHLQAHLILFTTTPHTEWEKKVGEEISGLSALQQEKKAFELKSDVKILLHVCEETRPEFPAFTVFCALNRGSYLVTDMKEENFADLFQFLSDSNPRSLKVETINAPQYFVCSHVKRDARCAYCGPRICDKIEEELAAKGHTQSVVRKIAHTGGHAYAANVLIFPIGDWLGNVTPVHVERIVKFYESGATDNIEQLGDLWRGRMGLTMDQQVHLSPHPKPQKALSLAKSLKKVKKLEQSQKERERKSSPTPIDRAEEGERKERSPMRAKRATTEASPPHGPISEDMKPEASDYADSAPVRNPEPVVPDAAKEPQEETRPRLPEPGDAFPVSSQPESRPQRTNDNTEAIPNADSFLLGLIAAQLLLMILFA